MIVRGGMALRRVWVTLALAMSLVFAAMTGVSHAEQNLLASGSTAQVQTAGDIADGHQSGAVGHCLSHCAGHATIAHPTLGPGVRLTRAMSPYALAFSAPLESRLTPPPTRPPAA